MYTPKHFNLLQDFTKAELEYLIDFSIHLKDLKEKRIPHKYLEGQNIALIFDKTSSRTRSAFVVASHDLGAHSETLVKSDIQFGKKESVLDSAKVFGSMFDGIMLRVSKQDIVDTFVEHAGVPIWNGMTDEWHPTQMIADFMTIKEHYGSFDNQHIVFSGDGSSNVAVSLMLTSALLGVDMTTASPECLRPKSEVLELIDSIASKSGSSITFNVDPTVAVKKATVVYTDVWASMGEEDKFKERIDELYKYQVNKELVSHIEGDYIFMHCLPAFHNTDTEVGNYVKEKYGIDEMEVTDDVFKSPNAKQFEQAENRLHSIKAIMASTNGHLFMPSV